MSGQSNGDAFEELIRWQNQRYLAKGEAVILKQATEFIPLRNNRGRICGAKVENKATVDFIGRVGTMPIALEAKHTASDRISLLAVEDHQSEFMNQWMKDSDEDCFGFVLVSFKLEEFYMVPWGDWSECRRAWKGKSGSKAEPMHTKTTGWEYNGMGSIHKKDMHPTWKVKCNGQNGLPYLEVATC